MCCCNLVIYYSSFNELNIGTVKCWLVLLQKLQLHRKSVFVHDCKRYRLYWTSNSDRNILKVPCTHHFKSQANAGLLSGERNGKMAIIFIVIILCACATVNDRSYFPSTLYVMYPVTGCNDLSCVSKWYRLNRQSMEMCRKTWALSATEHLTGLGKYVPFMHLWIH